MWELRTRPEHDVHRVLAHVAKQRRRDVTLVRAACGLVLLALLVMNTACSSNADVVAAVEDQATAAQPTAVPETAPIADDSQQVAPTATAIPPTATPVPPPTATPAPVAPTTWSCSDPTGDVDAAGGSAPAGVDIVRADITIESGSILAVFELAAPLRSAPASSGSSASLRAQISDTASWSSGQSESLDYLIIRNGDSFEESTGVRVDDPPIEVRDSPGSVSLRLDSRYVPAWVTAAPVLYAGVSSGGFIEGASLVDECGWTDVGLSEMSR